MLDSHHRACPQIEEHVLHYISSEGGQLWARLSPHEQEFAKGCVHAACPRGAPARILSRNGWPRYTDIVEEHFRASVLHALPLQYDSIIKQIDDGDDGAGASLDMSASRPSHTCICALSADPLRRRQPALSLMCSTRAESE